MILPSASLLYVPYQPMLRAPTSLYYVPLPAYTTCPYLLGASLLTERDDPNESGQVGGG
jgi:hypothetical protein